MILPTLINPLSKNISIQIPALLLLVNFNVYSAESESCKEAKTVYQINRKEQRNGYKIRRGNWLNCIEDKSNDAKRKYCRLKKVNDGKYTSVKTEVEAICSQKGLKRN